MQANRWEDALPPIDAALHASPGAPRWLLRKAQCLLGLGRRAAAGDAARASLAAATDAVLLDALGSFFSFVGDQVTALDAFQRATALAPGNPHFLFNRATVRRFLGEFEAAQTDYDRVIALRCDDFEAYKNRSDLRTQTAAANHVEELQRLIARGFADWRGEVQIRHALAKEYEDLGQYERSFEQLRAGARKRRGALNYDVAADVATVEWIIAAFPGAESGPRPCVPAPRATGVASAGPADAPIFVVGLPRSGTTLVDRIVSSHARVRSAGELNDFALALVARVQRERGTRRLPRRDLVASSAAIDFSALGREYLARARAVIGEGRFVDKMPLNYLYCGLIRRALPDARIVHLTRHPMAVCYAMYKTLFKDGYPFSYDLEDIARYYIAYRRLMDHWRAALPDCLYELSYEALIADQAGETRRLLDFCGLPWQDECLAFHRNPSPVTTASASQIRQPLYDSSVSQWRHYEAQLSGLREKLTAAGIAT